MQIAMLSICLGCLLACGSTTRAAFSGDDDAFHAFSTGGHTVYHLRCGQIQSVGDRALIAASLDGTVLCFTRDGDLLWKNQANRSLPLDLDVADLDGDGRDETLVASADGVLYVLDHAGQLRCFLCVQPSP